MNNFQIAQLAIVFAEQARVLGMQAENATIIARGETAVYGEASFNSRAKALEEIALRLADYYPDD